MSTVVKDLGAVSAYAYAVEKGYTGTEAEFAELMADYAEVGQRAEDAANSALESKTAAQTAATTATNKASEATTAAQTATTKAGEAQTSAQTASSKASEASQSASQASGYAQTAETAKTDAQTAKTQAETARDNAVTAKIAAETAQGKAEDAQAAAESVAESIPSDYSQLSEDVSDLKEDLSDAVNDINASISQIVTATGTEIELTDAKTAPAVSLTANADCTVTITGRNLISADFSTAEVITAPDESILIGKGGYNYWYPSRVTDVVLSKDTISLKRIGSGGASSTGVGIKVAVRNGHTYVLSYQTNTYGYVCLSAWGEDAYIGNIKDNAPSGSSFTLNNANIKYVIVSFSCSDVNQTATYANIQLEEATTEHDFVPYQKKETVQIVDGVGDVTDINTYSPETNIYNDSDAEMTIEYLRPITNYIEDIKANLQGQINAKPSIADVQSNAFVSSYNILDGWENHAKAFAQLMIDCNDTESFMFFTDTHFMAKQTESAWKEFAYAIFAYMEQLYYASPCSFVLHGGDWLGSGELQSSIIYKLGVIGGVFRSKINRFALLVGNHETGNQHKIHDGDTNNAEMTHDTLACTLLANVGKTYYVFKANTFTMYCFDTWKNADLDASGKEQVKWFAKCLESETAEHIVIAMHILHDNGNVKAMGDEITKCADAYNNQTTYTYDGLSCDYSNAVGKVAFVIAGHTHVDATGTVNNIPYIETKNTTEYSDTTFTNLPLPVDLIKVDWDNELLTAYRAARGAEGTTRTLAIIGA